MKDMKVHTTFTMMFLLLASGLFAQSKREGLLLLTDRGHYISGETIFYKALYRGPGEVGSENWSKILYVELVMPNGSSLDQHKIILDPQGGKGKLNIPEGISSGTYYLKAYTRWMRNCGPEAFSYTSIQVYDTYKESVLPVDSTGWEAASPQQLISEPGLHSEDVLECILEKSNLQTREKVHLNLTWKFPDTPSNVTLSVAKAGLQGNQQYINPGCQISGEQETSFLPETQGLSLTGQAVGSVDRLPAAYATIYVSVLGEEREFFCNYSDSSGRFYFSFPGYVDERDLFVSTFHPEYEDLDLLIDRDFNNDQIYLPSHPIHLNDTLASTITEMSVNFQVSQQYYPPEIQKVEVEKGDGRLFYGNPTATVKFDDFVNLPRLEEYFIEVVPQVAVRKTKGERRFVVLGEHPDLNIYQPLVMIDGVAIFDVEAVLDVSPRLIDRVEIINAPYIRGNVTFGGIISIISRNNDLGYIDLPSSGLLVNYQMLDLPIDSSHLSASMDQRLPDVRNTLYWNPGVEIQPDETRQFTFSTADASGDYEILIRGIDSAGNYFSKTVPFRVE